MGTSTAEEPLIPLWLKLLVTAWLLVWVPIYWIAHGPQNFLWFCDLANFLIAAALWLESPLLFSSQAVAVMLIQVAWVIDVLSRLLFGFHVIGGTAYMFDDTRPLSLRLLSLLLHVGILVLLLWGLRRIGYDPRGLRLQIAIAMVVLPASWLYGPELNLNWTWGGFGTAQEAINPLLWLAIAMAGYVVVLCLPTHWALLKWAPRAPGVAARNAAD
jgi:hypothetical protein